MVSQTFQMVMRTDPTPNKVFEITGDLLTIGRDASNDIVINDPEVSRKHARLVSQVGGYILEDLGSTNGTFVNGQRLIGPHLLKPDEVIMFGENITLSFEALQFDPDATVVASYNLPTYPAPPPTPGTARPPADRPVAVYQPPTASQMPTAVVEPTPITPTVISSAAVQTAADEVEEEEEAARKISRTWLVAGIGCLLVTICVCVAAAYAFDTINLYCVPPFNSLFSWLYTCP